jgi:tyrosine-protein kinase Etk/Wzc
LQEVGPTFDLRRVKPNSPSRDSIDLGELGAALRQSWRWIVVCAILAVCIVLAVTLTSQMTFKTSGSLYLGETQGKSNPVRSSDTMDLLGTADSELGTEIEILKSETLVGRAVLESGLNVRVTPYGWNPPQYWQWRKSHRDPDALEPALKEIGATGSLGDGVRYSQAYKVRFVSGTDYELWSDPKGFASSKLGQLISRIRPGLLSEAEPQRLGKGKLGDVLATPGLRLTLVKGVARGPRPGAEYSVVVHPLDDVVASIVEGLTVAPPKSAAPGQSVSVVKVEFADTSPALAKAFLEKLMRGYLAQRQNWKTEEATAAETFVTNQLRGMRESLDTAEKQLANYKEKSGVVMLSDEARAMIEQLGTFEQQRVAARLQVSAMKDIEKKLKKGDSVPVEAYMLGESHDTVLAGLGESLTKAQEELKRLEQEFTEDAPAVRDQRAQVDARREMVKNYVATRASRAHEQLSSLSGIIGGFENKLKTVPRAELELAQLGRHAEVMSKIYSYLLERQQQAAIVKAATISDNRILDLPKLPTREDSPTLGKRLLAGALFGLLLGTVFVFGRRRFAPTFQSVVDVQRKLDGLPSFSVVPRRPKLRRRNNASPDLQPPVFDAISEDPGSGFAEAFRLLRANLYRSAARGGGSNVILVTSPNPGDGKTLCTLALAATLAADNKRVLVIDSDMHKPSHHSVLGLWQEPGLSNVLSGKSHWREVINSVPLARGELHAIPAGEGLPGTSEWFSSLHVANFFADVRRYYDFILLDSPSFPLVSDALMMSTHADRVLSVIRVRNTRRTLAEEHVSRLSSLAPCALVINDAEASPHDRYGYGRARDYLQKSKRKPPRKRMESGLRATA